MKNQRPFAGLIVHERYICANCNGAKIIRNPIWDSFWEKRELKPHVATVADLQQFMQEHGASTVPAEAFTCPKCGGSGNEDIEISLKEALLKLGDVWHDRKKD